MNIRSCFFLAIALFTLGAHSISAQKGVRPQQKAKPVASVQAVGASLSPQREAADLEFVMTLARFVEDDDAVAAREGFLRVLDLDPTYPQPRYNLAILAELQGDRAETIKWFSEYLKFDRKSGHAQRAQERLRQLQTADPAAGAEEAKAGNYNSLVSRAQLLAEAGFLKEAVAQLYQATELDETRWEAYEQTAVILAQQGLFDDARTFEQMANLRATPTQKAAIEAERRQKAARPDYAARSEAGFMRFEAKDYASAAEAFSKAWALSPKRTEAGFAAAVAFTAAGEVVEATMILNRLKVNPDPAVSEKAKRMLQKLVKK